MLTIVAVVAASATLQASGGLEVLLLMAEKVLRRNPKYVSILAPFVTTFLTMLCGTGHVVYTMLPIIYDIAIKNGIRPERPMAGSSIGAQMGIIASPVSVAVVSLAAIGCDDKKPSSPAKKEESKKEEKKKEEGKKEEAKKEESKKEEPKKEEPKKVEEPKKEEPKKEEPKKDEPKKDEPKKG